MSISGQDHGALTARRSGRAQYQIAEQSGQALPIVDWLSVAALACGLLFPTGAVAGIKPLAVSSA
jgi:hypothetical protein